MIIEAPDKEEAVDRAEEAGDSDVEAGKASVTVPAAEWDAEAAVKEGEEGDASVMTVSLRG